jgi:hypothetical protein
MREQNAMRELRPADPAGTVGPETSKTVRDELPGHETIWGKE